MNWVWSKNKGQSILEVILALAVFALFAAAMVSLILGSFETLGRGGDYLTAAALAEEGLEAARAIRDGAWNELIFNKSAATSTSGEWQFAGEGTDEQIGKFHRLITFSPVCRDGSLNLTICPAGPVDLHSRGAQVVIDWTNPVGAAAAVESQTMFTNWDSRDWVGTDWSGGDGQSTWSDSTRYDSDDGNLDISPGELKLQSTTSAGGSANPDFTGGTSGWSFASWDASAGEVTPSGSWQAAGGNPGGYADITIPANARNNTVGGYWQQTVTVADDGLPIFCSADWRVTDWNVAGNNVDDFRFFMFLDADPGAPVLGQEVWVSPSVVGVTGWEAAANIDCSAFAPTAGAYYFKIAVWLDAPSRRTGPITAGFDNARIAWSKTSYALNGELVSSAFDLGDPSPVQIIEWDEQIPVCVPASVCNVKFKIRAADDSTMTGVPWPPDSEFFTASAGALIPASYNGKRWVQYRVFLSGDGNATPILNEVRINYK